MKSSKTDMLQCASSDRTRAEFIEKISTRLPLCDISTSCPHGMMPNVAQKAHKTGRLKWVFSRSESQPAHSTSAILPTTRSVGYEIADPIAKNTESLRDLVAGCTLSWPYPVVDCRSSKLVIAILTILIAV